MGLEEKVGEKFDGNLWDAVNWVEGQGTDLSTLPRFPSP